MADEDIIFPSKEEFVKYSQNCVLLEDHSQIADLGLINSKLILYLKTISNHIQIFLNDDVDFYQFALYLVNSELFEYNKVFCISKILSVLKICAIESSAIELNFRFFINYVLLLECKNDSESLQVTLDFDAFKILYQCLRNNFKTLHSLNVNEDIESGTVMILKKLITIQLDLLFQFCKYLSLPLNDLLIVDRKVIDHIFKTLIVAYNEEDFYNAAKFKFILALNEQYMINKHNETGQALDNLVFQTIQTSRSNSRNFIECLLIYFNRENDKVLQIMISKILYLIFTHSDTNEMFYSNDLNVLVDVLIRELTNLENEEISIKNTFLRVLFPILKNDQFSNTLYKKDQLLNILRFLSGDSSNFFKQNETTERLAKKCLSIDWLKEDYIDEPPIPLHLTQSNESSTSLNSMSKKRVPPPIPLPRKLFHKHRPPIPSPRLGR